MTEEAKEARRAYQREWRRRNPDKVKGYAARYWTKLAEQQGDSIPQKTAESSKNEGSGVE